MVSLPSADGGADDDCGWRDYVDEYPSQLSSFASRIYQPWCRKIKRICQHGWPLFMHKETEYPDVFGRMDTDGNMVPFEPLPNRAPDAVVEQEWIPVSAAVNTAVGLATLIFTAFLSEFILRRREGRKPPAPP